MDDDKFVSGLVKTLVIGFCVLVGTIASCNMNRHYQTRMLIENAKVNPIDAKCAIEGDNLVQNACVLRAIK